MKRTLIFYLALVFAFSLVSSSLVFSEEATEKASAQTEEVKKEEAAAPAESEEAKAPEAEEAKAPEKAKTSECEKGKAKKTEEAE